MFIATGVLRMQVFLTVFWDAVHKWAVVYAWPSIVTAAISISDANFGVSGAIRAYRMTVVLWAQQQ